VPLQLDRIPGCAKNGKFSRSEGGPANARRSHRPVRSQLARRSISASAPGEKGRLCPPKDRVVANNRVLGGRSPRITVHDPAVTVTFTSSVMYGGELKSRGAFPFFMRGRVVIFPRSVYSLQDTIGVCVVNARLGGVCPRESGALRSLAVKASLSQGPVETSLNTVLENRT
jgi:hypothetical protein